MKNYYIAADVHSEKFKLKDGNYTNPYTETRYYSNLRKSTLFKHGIDLTNLFILIDYMIPPIILFYIGRVIAHTTKRTADCCR